MSVLSGRNSRGTQGTHCQRAATPLAARFRRARLSGCLLLVRAAAVLMVGVAVRGEPTERPSPRLRGVTVLHVSVEGDDGADGGSWAAAKRTVQAAIEACVSSGGGQVWIAAGVYTPISRPNGGDAADSRTMHFSLRNGVAVHGGFPADAADGRADSDDITDAIPTVHATILSGDVGVADTDADADGVPDAAGGDSGDNCYHVFYHPEEAALGITASLSGVTITAGLDRRELPTLKRDGGGMYNSHCSPTLHECAFSQNAVSGGGGGMYNEWSSPSLSALSFTANSAAVGGGMYNRESTFTVSASIFTENRGGEGGGMFSYFSSLELSDCRFVENQAAIGGGMAANASSVRVVRSLFADHKEGGWGGAIDIGESRIELLSCHFVGNACYDDGGAVSGYCEPGSLIANCFFGDNNSQSQGGAVFSASPPGLTLMNCTFVANRAAGAGGGLLDFHGTATVTNCVFWDNGDELAVDGSAAGGPSTVSNCVIDLPDLAAYPDSNTNADPLFVDAADPDGEDDIWGTGDDGLRLAYGSPGIDAGDTGVLPPDTLDLDGDGDIAELLPVDSRGETRVSGDTVDIGTYEFQQPAHLVTFSPGAHGGITGGTPDLIHHLEDGAQMPVPPEVVPDSGHAFSHWSLAFPSAVNQDVTVTAQYTLFNDVIYVSHHGDDGNNGLSWATAKRHLQAAIDLCAQLGGGEVWVAAGTYRPALRPNGGDPEDPRTMHFSLRNNVAVHGGFPADAVDSGTDCDETVDADPLLNRTVLSGDIGAADSDGNGDGIPDVPGGDSKDNCYNMFYHPETLGLGQSASLSGVIITAGDATRRWDIQEEPLGFGAGMHNVGASPTIKRCVFVGNRARNGGGAMHNSASSPALANCVLMENASGGTGNGINNDEESYPLLTNCILWHNGDEIMGGDPVLVTHCLIDLPDVSMYPASNVSGDPLFVDTGGGDFAILPGSPCIDAGDGTNAGAAAQILDGDGDGQATIDIGLAEYVPPSLGSFRIAFRTDGSPGGGLSTPGGMSDDVVVTVTEGADAPAIEALLAAGVHFLGWERHDGVREDESVLTVTGVDQGQTWTALFGAAMPDDAGIVYVKQGGTGDGSSWDMATGDPQTGIEACAKIGGGQVWVAAGVYRPTSRPNGGWESDPRAAHFSLRNNVSMYGGFPADAASGRTDCDNLDDRDPESHRTIFSGDIGVPDADADGDGIPATAGGDSYDNAYHVFYHPADAALAPSAALTGVTITGGCAYGWPDVWCGYAGGGVHNVLSSPLLTDCLIVANSGSFGGGVANGPGASPTVRDCTFLRNVGWDLGGGGMGNSGPCSPVVSRCVFAQNRAWQGAGMCNRSASPTVEGCFLVGNVVEYNEWSGGGMDNWESDAVVTNCVFTGNEAASGGGMSNGASSPTVTNCTFAYNGPHGGVGGMDNYESSPLVRNCVFRGDNNERLLGGDPSLVQHSVLEAADIAAFPVSNTDGDPLFIDPADPDGPDDIWGTVDDGLRVVVGSSAVDAGDVAALPPDTQDLDGDGDVAELLPVDIVGRPRVSGGSIEIGAYEFHEPARRVTFHPGDHGSLVGGAPDVVIDVEDAGGAPSPPTVLPEASYAFLGWHPPVPEIVTEDTEVTAQYSVFGGVIHVSAATGDDRNGGLSWATAKRDPQAAIELCAQLGGGQVWVAAGIYKPTSRPNADGTYNPKDPRTVHFALRNGVAVIGGFPMDAVDGREDNDDPTDSDPVTNRTIFSGDIGEPDTDNDGDGVPDDAGGDSEDNCIHVFYHPDAELGPSAFLHGVIITAGNAVNPVSGKPGGGMRNIGASPELSECTFAANSASVGGAVGYWGGTPAFVHCSFVGNEAGSGGAVFSSDSASPSFTECVFRDNEAMGDGGAVHSVQFGGLVLTRCSFEGNRAARGGAVSNSSDVFVLVGCLFRGNSGTTGGAVYDSSGATVSSSCIFTGNSAENGGAVFRGYAAGEVFANCMFHGNTADLDGGAVFIPGSSFSPSPALVNCMFIGNVAGRGGGAIDLAGTDLSVTTTNTVLWGNGDAINGDVAMSHCVIDVEDLTGYDPSNTNADPLFVDLDDPDGPDDIWGTPDDGLRPRFGSPCNDAGDTGALPADSADLDADGDTAEPFPLDIAGRPRISDGVVDIGAYEFHDPTWWVTFHPGAHGSLVDGTPGVAIEVGDGGDSPLPPAVVPEASYAFFGWDPPLAETITEDIEVTAQYAVFGGVIHVSAAAGNDRNGGLSWATAKRNPQTAIDLCAQLGGGQVWIAAGIYKPTTRPNGSWEDEDDPRALHFALRNGVAVYGGFPSDSTDGRIDSDDITDSDPVANRTIFSGDLGDSDVDGDGDGIPDEPGGDSGDNCVHVFHHPSAAELGPSAFLHGVTITAGRAEFTVGSILDSGGGMLNVDASPTLSECVFVRNRAMSGGGVHNTRGDPTFTRCSFVENDAYGGGGVKSLGTGAPVFSECLFEDNRAGSGGGVSEGGVSALFSGCVFTNNDSGEGGAIVQYRPGSTVLANCVFFGNTTDGSGGAMSIMQLSEDPVVSITNCIFVGNTAERGIGTIGAFSDGISVTNSVLWHNGDRAYGKEDMAHCIIDVADLTGYDPSNRNADPLFVNLDDPDGPDDIWGTADDGLRLKYGSPGIDAGDTGALPADSADLDADGDTAEPLPLDIVGRPRVSDGVVDIGAYEWQAPGRTVTFHPGAHGDLAEGTPDVVVVVEDGAAAPSSPIVTPREWYVFAGWEPSLPAVIAADTATTAQYELMPMAEAPLFSPADGSVFRDTLDVSLSCLTEGGDIWYTLDGRDPVPDVDGTLVYTAPLTITESMTVKAIAIGEHTRPSPVATATYQRWDGVIHVSESGNNTGNGFSWAEAKSDPQVAIDLCAQLGGGQVWVAAGVYKPLSQPRSELNDPHFTLRNGVAVYGGFPAGAVDGDPDCDEPGDVDPATNHTIFSGDTGTPDSATNGIPDVAGGDSEDNCSHVFYHPPSAGLDETAVLQGVTVTAGDALVWGVMPDGGGIYNDGASPTFIDCRIARNRGQYGGGVRNIGSAAPLFVGCVFEGNGAERGSAVNSDRAWPTFINCAFTGNDASPLSGAVENFSVQEPTLTVIHGSIFNGNSGAGVSVLCLAATEITNCTFVGNGAGLALQNSEEATVTNSILWDTGELFTGGGSAWLDHCVIDVDDLSPYPDTNTNVDPLFADPGDPDGPDDIWGTDDDGLQLSVSSPCIDMGDTGALPSDTADLDGDGDVSEPIPLDLVRAVRVVGDAVDIGTHEYPLVVHRVVFLPGVHGDLVEGSPDVVVQVVHGGTAPETPGVVPHSGYGFSGWSPSLPAVIAADVDLTAQYAFLSTVETPAFQPFHGTRFVESLAVSIDSPTQGADIWYTLDGTDPGPEALGALLYLEPFTLAATTTVRAAAFKAGMNASTISSATYAQIIGWEQTLTISDENRARGGVTLTVGMHPDEVDDDEYSDTFDVQAASLPVEGVFGALLLQHLGPGRFDGNIMTYAADTRLEADHGEWMMAVQGNATDPVVISWSDMVELGVSNALAITEVDVIDGHAIGETSDLTTSGSVTLSPGTALRFFHIQYDDVLPTIDIVLKQGWNLVSTPGRPGEPSPAAVFGTVVASEGRSFRDGLRGTIHTTEVWWWDNEDGLYRLAETMEGMRGHWVYTETDIRVTVSYRRPLGTTRPVGRGWNLIGPANDMEVPSWAGLLGKTWRWNAGTQGYRHADTFVIGTGYWACFDEATTVSLDGN